MKSDAAREPLEKLVQEYDLIDSKIRDLEKRAVAIPERRKKLIASGAFDDPKFVGEISTLATQASMIPFRLQEYEEARQDVSNRIQQLWPAMQPVLAQQRDELEAAVKDQLARAIEVPLRRFLGHDSALVHLRAEQLTEESLVLISIRRFPMLLGLSSSFTGDTADPGESARTTWVQKARNQLRLHAELERIKGVFFSGNSLNLEAVARVTEFKVGGLSATAGMAPAV